MTFKDPPKLEANSASTDESGYNTDATLGAGKKAAGSSKPKMLTPLVPTQKTGPSDPAPTKINAKKEKVKKTPFPGTSVTPLLASNFKKILEQYEINENDERLQEIADMPKTAPTPSSSGLSEAQSAAVSAGPATAPTKSNKGKVKAAVSD